MYLHSFLSLWRLHIWQNSPYLGISKGADLFNYCLTQYMAEAEAAKLPGIEVKRRRRTSLQAGGACEAPPHEN